MRRLGIVTKATGPDDEELATKASIVQHRSDHDFIGFAKWLRSEHEW